MKRWIWSAALAAAVVMCTKNEGPVSRAPRSATRPGEADAAMGRSGNVLSRAQQRSDVAWQQLQSFREQQAVRTAQQPGTVTAPPQSIQFVTDVKQSFKGLDMNLINSAPVSV